MTSEMIFVTDDTDIDYYFKELHTLTELGFLYSRTERGIWYTVLNEAWNNSRLPRHDDVQFYLTFFLERYVKDVEVVDTFVGFEYYVSLIELDKVDTRCLQRLADICLLYASLYPGKITHRHYPTTMKSVVELGETIYNSLALAERTENWKKNAFKELSESFMRYAFVLKWINKALPAQMQKLERLNTQCLKLPSKHKTLELQQKKKMFELMYLKLNN